MKNNNDYIIAKFMGGKLVKHDQLGGVYGYAHKWQSDYKCINNKISPAKFDFQTNWNSLMLVIKRIRTIYLSDEFQMDDSIGMYYVYVYNALDQLDIDLTYLEVLKFINWYNENKK